MSPHPPYAPARRRALSLLALAALATATALPGVAQERTPSPPVKVTVRDEKPVVVDPETNPTMGGALPVDPVKRIQFNANGNVANIRSADNQTLHLSHFPSFLVDNQLY